MKKSLFYVAAASALMLTACSSENDVLQNATPTQQQTVVERAVGFDIYTPAASNVTRAGLEGTMTTNRLQRSEYEGGGFGVYAYLVQDTDPAANVATAYNPANPGAPGFMANEKLLWNATNQGWYYNPLKYWPNETNNDSQDTNATMETAVTPYTGSASRHLDRLSFFAYAPYVKTAGGIGVNGITRITSKNGKLSATTVDNDDAGTWNTVREATIGYKAAISNPNEAVDLLWGVAPSGGLEYTAVNGQTVKVEEGMPLIDMTKPNVNTNMKFLFQHALARIGVTAVAAIDQVGAGGKLDPNTKITIEKITLTGYFGETGFLNLDNTIPSVANWEIVNDKTLATQPFNSLVKTTLTLQANHTSSIDGQNGTIATHLQWVNDGTGGPDAQTNRVGVTTVRQNVIQPALIDNTPGTNRNWYTSKKYDANQLAYSESTPYYTAAACADGDLATVTMPASYTVNSKGVYSPVAANANFKYPMVLQNYKQGSWHKVTAAEVTAGTYANCKPYKEKATGVYIPKTSNNKVEENDYIVDGILFYGIGGQNEAEFAGEQVYKLSSTNYVPEPVGTPVKSGQSQFVICGQKEFYVPYYAANTYYRRDANYFMVIPTNNFVNENPSYTSNEKDLRTVRVEIEYYITTEDASLANGRAQTKNVITKDVVFPSIANGKSYNLNLILGLTSVKMEAEVDDWKVINVQADLPQNTAD